MSKRLTNDMVGTIAYTLTIDGEVVDVVARDEAIEYLHGAENLVPGLEQALEGKAAGDSFEITLEPADGYGDYDDEDIEVLSVDDFEGVDELEPGMELEIMDDEGEFYEAVILSVDGENVTVDFNHPFAGKTLHYSVDVIDVRDATEKEIDLGYPESLIEEIYTDLDHDHVHVHEDVEFSEN